MLWTNLASDDPLSALSAVFKMVSAPHEAAAFLRARLRPVAPVPESKVQQLVAQLGDEKYAVRQGAYKALLGLGESVEPMLREALKEAKDAEVRVRLQGLLDAFAGGFVVDSMVLRDIRAVGVLERIGNAQARAVLTALSQGADSARQTQAAREALSRLAARCATPH